MTQSQQRSNLGRWVGVVTAFMCALAGGAVWCVLASMAFTAAPFSIKAAIASGCRDRAAAINTVSPSGPVSFSSAPALSSRRTMAAFPFEPA